MVTTQQVGLLVLFLNVAAETQQTELSSVDGVRVFYPWKVNLRSNGHHNDPPNDEYIIEQEQ